MRNSRRYERISQKHAVHRVSAFTKEYDSNNFFFLSNFLLHQFFYVVKQIKCLIIIVFQEATKNWIIFWSSNALNGHNIRVYFSRRTRMRRSVAVFIIIITISNHARISLKEKMANGRAECLRREGKKENEIRRKRMREKENERETGRNRRSAHHTELERHWIWTETAINTAILKWMYSIYVCFKTCTFYSNIS